MKNYFSDAKRTRLALNFVVILVLLTGCAGPVTTSSPLPSATAFPTSTSPAPAVTAASQSTNTPDEQISEPGKYEGYSEALYNGKTALSQYITMRDGIKLAALIIRPAQDGTTVETPLPVIWTHNRYHRENVYDWPHILPLLKYGYVIVSVDVRGSGASFGKYLGLFSPEETNDAYDITEWLAAQPWSDGNIGMYGRSYLGITQYMAASEAPPHLKAIFPEMSEFDHYSFMYPGGVFHDDFFRRWGNMIKKLDTDGLAVTEDLNKTDLQDALKEHATNQDVYEMYSPLMYRDSLSPITGTQPYKVNNPADYLKEIRSSGVPVYMWDGWYDMFPKDALLWYSNLTNPRKIVIGPWAHPELGSLDLTTELLRWYDYWLKGIDNGVMSEAPIYYYTMGDVKNSGWHSAWQWPLPNEKRTNYYFDGTHAGSIDSINDGSSHSCSTCNDSRSG